MANAGRNDGLGVIFSIFLGLMVTAFVGVGVYTFHAPPNQYDAKLRELSKQEQEIKGSRAESQLSEAERQRLQAINEQQEKLSEARRLANRQWSRTTSITLIALATLVMAISLIRADHLPVVSNGLLLGGVFTMLYGVGWMLTVDDSISRFIAITIALIITLVLGYIRFVRRRAPMVAAPAVSGPGAATAEPGSLADIEQRLSRLELRLADAARALEPKC